MLFLQAAEMGSPANSQKLYFLPRAFFNRAIKVGCVSIAAFSGRWGAK
jgi:hypothetical protein